MQCSISFGGKLFLNIIILMFRKLLPLASTFETKHEKCHEMLRLPGTYAAKIDEMFPSIIQLLDHWGKHTRGVWFSSIIAAYAPGNLNDLFQKNQMSQLPAFFASNWIFEYPENGKICNYLQQFRYNRKRSFVQNKLCVFSHLPRTFYYVSEK